MKKLQLVAFIALVMAVPMFAANTGSALPWEGAMDKLVSSITGPVAFGISIIAIVAAGAGLIFGGEISGFLKSTMILALVIGMIVASAKVLSGLFGVGAVIAANYSPLLNLVA